MHATAFTTGEHVGLKAPPDLWLAAHEATHVVQQRGGVSLSGGVGRAGDPYERQADTVADRVVSGRPAHDLLAGSRAAGLLAVQRCGGVIHEGCECARETGETAGEASTAVQRNGDGGLLGALSSAVSTVTSAAGEVAAGVESAATTVASAVGEVASDVGSAVSSAAQAVIGTVSDIAADVEGAISAGIKAAGADITAATSPTSTWSGGAPPADMIVVRGSVVPNVRGTVEAAPDKKDPTMIMAIAPEIMMPPITVKLDDTKYQIESGKSVQVGFIQTVSSSRRIARYEAPGGKPGDPPVVFEMVVATSGPRRDVTLNPDDPSIAWVQPPWFVPPVLISPVHPSDKLKVANKGVPDLFDQPQSPASKTMGKGTLTGFGGADVYQTSVAAKDSDGPPTEVTHLQESTWTVPWDISVNPAMTGHGKEVATAPSGQAPSALIGPTAAEEKEDYLDFPTVAAAMAVEPEVLLRHLAATNAASFDGVVQQHGGRFDGQESGV